MKIKKGDTVIVITGKDKGKVGKVLETYPKEDRVLVDGVNIVSRHTKPRSAQDKGGIIKKPAPIHVSNVMILDENGKPTRIAHKIIDGKKVRVSKTTGESLDKEFKKVVKKESKKAKSEVEKVEENAEKPKAKSTTKKAETKTVKTAKTSEPKKATKTAEKPATTVKKTVSRSGK